MNYEGKKKGFDALKKGWVLSVELEEYGIYGSKVQQDRTDSNPLFFSEAQLVLISRQIGAAFKIKSNKKKRGATKVESPHNKETSNQLCF